MNVVDALMEQQQDPYKKKNFFLFHTSDGRIVLLEYNCQLFFACHWPKVSNCLHNIIITRQITIFHVGYGAFKEHSLL